jgi:hypothetical protein
MFVANPLNGAYLLLATGAIAQAAPGLPPALVATLGIGGFVNLAFAIAVWHWKRWGVYGLGISSAVVFVINATYLGVLAAAVGLLGFGVLLLLVGPLWRYFR